MRFLDLFAGIGGGRRGLELAGHKCVGFCESNKFAVASYTSMHLITDSQRNYLSGLSLKKRREEIQKDEYKNGEWYCSDIKEASGTSTPPAEIWIFGSPCTSFSLAGRRAGLEGESGLITEVFRLLREIKEADRPEWLIYENVKGVLQSNRGLDFIAILSEMDRLGYDAEWQNCNSRDLGGVPQWRERIYTIGHLRSRGSRQILPIGKPNEQVEFSLTHPNLCFYNPEHDGTCRTLKYQYQKNTSDNFNVGGERGASAVGIKYYSDDYDKPVVYIDLPDGTICARYNGGCYVAVRKLMPIECFRLQGWTDDYFHKAKFVNSNMQLYCQAGNGMTVGIVKQIGEKIT